MLNLQEIMKSDYEIITAIIGVGGTLLGTILGWLLNNLSRKGKLNTYVLSWKDSFEYNSLGSMIPSKSVEQTELYYYTLALDIHNSSSEPRIMRDIKIVFSNGKTDVYTEVPDDDSSKRHSGPITLYDKVLPQTIPAKSVFHISLRGGKWKSDTEDLYIWSVKRVYLEYINDKNRKKRVLLYCDDYSRYFENHRQTYLDRAVE